MLQLGAVLEGGRNVHWSMSSSQNLLYFGRRKGLRGRPALAARRRATARRLGLWERRLWERRDQLVGGFSRGVRQKVAAAAAFTRLWALPLRC